MKLIETTHLKTWASGKSAESRFPHLLKDLIRASIQPSKLKMPSGDAVWVPGYDGEIVNQEKNKFVPKGLSVWEAGTDASPITKAGKDYKKRTIDPTTKSTKSKPKKSIPARKINRSKTTFVFATPRVWAKKDDWVEERKKEKVWRDVIVIDGTDIQDWLEETDSVNLQFAAECGLAPSDGLHTPEQAWEEWSYLTEPPISEELICAGRGDQEKDVLNILSREPTLFTIRGDSPQEAWGFALATLRRAALHDVSQDLTSRIIVAEDEEAARGLRNLKNLIVILKGTKGQVSGFLTNSGCHVIVPEGNDFTSDHNVIVLARPSHNEVSTALSGMKIPEKEAEIIARDCGRSVTVFLRRKAAATSKQPEWANEEKALQLIPALLAGRWNENNELDKEIICKLCDTDDYETAADIFYPLLLIDEPPIRKIGKKWTLTAPIDAFELIAKRLRQSDLDRFGAAFQDVFGRKDPRTDTPVEDWLYLDSSDLSLHSDWLRSGMAETILLISQRGPSSRMRHNSPKDFAKSVVSNLPGLKDNWKVLASIRDQYPRLMEASPGPLLDSLEYQLGASDGELSKIFVEGDNSFGGGSLHTGLLWGLEIMAWSPNYLPRVSKILAQLAAIDPGGNLSNRPLNTLREIFLWWNPGTNASTNERLAAIDEILNDHPTIGWKLLEGLLPGQHSVSSGTSIPRWRDFGELSEDSQTRSGQLNYMTSIVDRGIDQLGVEAERWREILDCLSSVAPKQQEKVFLLLANIGQEKLAPTNLWAVVRGFVAQHRTFQDTEWALPEPTLERLEKILSELAPDDPIELYRWLFDDHLPDTPSSERDFDVREKEVEKLRKQAVRKTLDSYGIPGLVKLGTGSRYPGLLASAAVAELQDFELIFQFLIEAVEIKKNGINFASIISGEAHRIYKTDWSNYFLEKSKNMKWRPKTVGLLISRWHDDRETWNFVSDLGPDTESTYWQNKLLFILKGSEEDKEYQVDRLISNGRAIEALDLLAMKAKGVSSKALLRVFDEAFSQFTQPDAADQLRKVNLNSYDIRRYLNHIRERVDITKDEIARREYTALPLLGHRERQGLAIHEFMASDPAFFVDVICDVFLPSNRDKDSAPPSSENGVALAKAGFWLLEGMHQIPGMDSKGDIHEATLKKWIVKVRKLAAERDRKAITDQKIGSILAHAPDDPGDGAWPHKIIRNAIEKAAKKEILRGISIERFNMRGVYSKALLEGGEQERKIAKKYRKWASVTETKWPKTTKLLNSISGNWEETARQEDTRAEQDKHE